MKRSGHVSDDRDALPSSPLRSLVDSSLFLHAVVVCGEKACRVVVFAIPRVATGNDWKQGWAAYPGPIIHPWAGRLHVFWGSDFGRRPEGRGRRILSKSSLLLLVSPMLPTPPLVSQATFLSRNIFSVTQDVPQTSLTAAALTYILYLNFRLNDGKGWWHFLLTTTFLNFSLCDDQVNCY